jgi:hypothetical protein
MEATETNGAARAGTGLAATSALASTSRTGADNHNVRLAIYGSDGRTRSSPHPVLKSSNLDG